MAPKSLVPLLDVRELATALALPIGSVYKLVEAGTIPHVRLGARIRFETSAIEDWIANNRRSAEASR
jgi:excisionase family DNA binding protein